jgi:CDP-diacylglycerol--glycerol-3-phosphate 3-phosphatidyltransferase
MGLANKITIIRILCIPLFLVFMMIDTELAQWIALVVFLLLASTDSLDGYIARKRNEVTVLGKFMDPLADKLLVTAALVIFVERGDISSIIVIIILSREFIVTGLRSLAASFGVVLAASNWGKAKTISQIIAIVALFFNEKLKSVAGFNLTNLLVWIALLLTIVSGIDYIIKNKTLLKQNK